MRVEVNPFQLGKVNQLGRSGIGLDKTQTAAYAGESFFDGELLEETKEVIAINETALLIGKNETPTSLKSNKEVLITSKSCNQPFTKDMIKTQRSKTELKDGDSNKIAAENSENLFDRGLINILKSDRF